MSRKIIIRVLAVLICLLIAGGFGVGYAAYQRAKDYDEEQMLADQIAAEADIEEPIVVDENANVIVPEEDDTDFIIYNGEKYSRNERLLTLVLLGIDADEGRASLGARSDVMVVFTLDADTHEASMIVCPRDTQAMVRHTDKDGNETKRTLTKLNHSFPYGNGNNDRDMGAENVLYNMSNVLSCEGKYDVKLALYGGLDMTGIGPLTDAVGGVELEMPANISGVGKKGDIVKLNGEKAKLYNTTRKNVQGGSDVSRGQRQMVYLKALLKQIKSITPTQIPSVYTQLTANTFTNLTTDQMVGYAKQLQLVDIDALVPVNLEGTNLNTDASYWKLDEDKLEELVVNTFYKKLDDNTPSPSVTDDTDVTDLLSPGVSTSATASDDQ